MIPNGLSTVVEEMPTVYSTIKFHATLPIYKERRGRIKTNLLLNKLLEVFNSALSHLAIKETVLKTIGWASFEERI